MSDPVFLVVFVATNSVDGRHLVLVTARQGSCGKVVYSSCLSVHIGQGLPMMHGPP